MSCILCENLVEYTHRNYCSLGNLDLPDSIVRKAKTHKFCPLKHPPKVRRYTNYVPDLYMSECDYPRFKKSYNEEGRRR